MKDVALTVAFQAEVQSPLVWTRLVGSGNPRLISVGPMHPISSLTGATWWSELSTMSRLTDIPLAMLSHSEIGKPLGSDLATATHLSTAGMLSLMKRRMRRDSSELLLPVCRTATSCSYHGISLSKIFFLLLDSPRSPSNSSESELESEGECHRRL